MVRLTATRLCPALAAIALGFALEGAAAAGEVPVLVAPFRATTPDAKGLSTLLHSFLEESLDRDPGLQVISVQDAGEIFDTPAWLYLDACPASEQVGCALIVGETARARFAVAGQIKPAVGGSTVQVSLIDVAGAREALSFQVELEDGDDEAFAAGIARLLNAMARGEAGQVFDIRDLEEGASADKQALATELENLGQEIGDVTTLSPRSEGRIERPRMTSADLAERLEGEGSKPWERLGLTPKAYLRFQNSGLSYQEWRTRANGRKGQLILRPGLGVLRAPVQGEYYGRYQDDPETFATVQSLAWQAVGSAAAPSVALSVGYGLHPAVEVGLVGGLTGGTFLVDIRGGEVGDPVRDVEPDSYPSRSLFFGPRVLGALLPASSVRPVVGGDLLVWRGAAVEQYVLPPASKGLPTFGAPTLLLAELVAGVEARLGANLDAWLHVPLSASVAGATSSIYEDGGDYLESRRDPVEPGAVGAGLLLGLQVRLLGAREADTRRDFNDDPDE